MPIVCSETGLRAEDRSVLYVFYVPQRAAVTLPAGQVVNVSAPYVSASLCCVSAAGKPEFSG